MYCYHTCTFALSCQVVGEAGATAAASWGSVAMVTDTLVSTVPASGSVEREDQLVIQEGQTRNCTSLILMQAF